MGRSRRQTQQTPVPDSTVVTMIKRDGGWLGTAMGPGFDTVDSPIGYRDEFTCLRDLIELVEAQAKAER